MDNGIPTKGSTLAEQIYTIMKGCFFPASSTFGEFWKKTVLWEFIHNSGMPLGHKTIQDATGLEDKWLTYALDNLKEEGYIEKIDSPASFLFQGTDGDGYQLKMDAKDAEREAQTVLEKDQAANATPAEVAQPTETADATKRM